MGWRGDAKRTTWSAKHTGLAYWKTFDCFFLVSQPLAYWKFLLRLTLTCFQACKGVLCLFSLKNLPRKINMLKKRKKNCNVTNLKFNQIKWQQDVSPHFLYKPISLDKPNEPAYYYNKNMYICSWSAHLFYFLCSLVSWIGSIHWSWKWVHLKAELFPPKAPKKYLSCSLIGWHFMVFQ